MKNRLTILLTVFLILALYSNAQDITTDLTVYWDFNGDYFDKATDGENPDDLVNDDDPGVDFIDGQNGFGDALSFNEPGSADNAVFTVEEGGEGFLDFKPESHLTYAAWINLPDGFNGIYARLLLHVKGSGAPGWNVIIWGRNKDVVVERDNHLSITAGSLYLSAPLEELVENDTWFHFAFTFDGEESEVKLYLNGETKNEEGWTWTGDAVAQKTINYGSGIDFVKKTLRNPNKIDMDEVRIYKRTLTGDDIAELYETKPNKVETGLGKYTKSNMYVSFLAQSNELEIRNAQAGMSYSVFNINGKSIAKGVLASKSANINTNSWLKGLYIVKVENEIFKVNK